MNVSRAPGQDAWALYRRLRVHPLAAALERLEWPTAVLDRSFCFVYVNAAFCEFTGKSARELCGLSARVMMGAEQEMERKALRRKVENGTVHVVLDLRPAAGSVVPTSLRLLPLNVPLTPGVAKGVAYLGSVCPPGREVERDDALIAIPWSALAGVPGAAGAPQAEAGKPPLLSRREEQVNTLLSLGCDTKRIAEVLGISESTVRVLRLRARRKLAMAG